MRGNVRGLPDLFEMGADAIVDDDYKEQVTVSYHATRGVGTRVHLGLPSKQNPKSDSDY